jgi:hypothetical protein
MNWLLSFLAFTQFVFGATPATQLENRIIHLFQADARERGLKAIHFDYADEDDYIGGMDVKEGILQISIGKSAMSNLGLSNDALAAIMCHELGHFFAGAPIKESGYSTEAQSDYFSSAVCLKKVFRDMGSVAVKTVDPEILRNCNESFKDVSERNVCYRSAMAGLELMTGFHRRFSKFDRSAFYARPETAKKDPGYYTGYPSLQCRMETVVAGAYCNSSEKKFDDKDENYSCDTGAGARPACWFPVR